MVPLDKDFLVTDSRNLGDAVSAVDEKMPTLNADESIRALEKHGIFLEPSDELPKVTKKPSITAHELSDMAGIEIIPSDEKEES